MGAAKPKRRAARPAPAENRRGSPEAVEKRRVARAFNDVLGGGGARAKLDGRTEKRRQRLLAELESGKARGGRRDLKPIDVLLRVQELLDLGEPLASLRKVTRGARKAGAVVDAAALAPVLARLHAAYGFRPEAYRFVGLDDDVLRAAGVLDAPRGARRAKARAAR